jgi:hypothetical protein
VPTLRGGAKHRDGLLGTTTRASSSGTRRALDAGMNSPRDSAKRIDYSQDLCGSWSDACMCVQIHILSTFKIPGHCGVQGHHHHHHHHHVT